MRILGLDIGSSSIKAVEVNAAFRRFEIHDYHEMRLGSETSVTEALSALIQGLAKKPDRIAAVLPSSYVTFRNMRLPTRDKRAIQSSLTFELEDELPFDLEKAIYDFAVVSQTSNQSLVHVAASLKEPFGEWLNALQAAGVDPQIVTSESWAFRTLMNRLIVEERRNQPIVLIQMGYKRTHLYVQHQGNPLIAREIAWGSWDIDHAIAEKFNISDEEATLVKNRSTGILLDDAQEGRDLDQKQLSDVMIGALNDLTRELRQAHYATKNLTSQSLAHAYVTGGASLLPGLREALQHVLRIPVEELKVLSSLSSSGVSFTPENDAIYGPAAAAALCFVPQDKIRPINFRKGPFAIKKTDRSFDFSNLKRPLLGLAAVYACAISSFTVQKMYYESKTGALDAQLERGLRAVFGNLSKNATRNHLSNTDRLKKTIEKELHSQRELSKLFGPSQKAPLAFLKGLSAQVPRDVVGDLAHIQVGASPDQPYDPEKRHEVELTFLLKSQQSAQKLSQIMDRVLDSPERTGPTSAQALDGASKAFKVTFKGLAKGEAYGK